MISLPRRALTRRKIAVGLAVGLTLSALALARTRSVTAAEVTTPYTMTCTVLGSPSTITTNITTSFTPDPVHAGETVTLTVKTSPPTGVPLDVPVTNVAITIPIPAQVDLTAPADVALVGGNLTGSATAQGTNLKVNLTSTVTAFNLQIPDMVITSKLKTGIEGQTINWQGPSNLDITATVVGPLQVPCTSAASNPPVAVTPVAAAATTTTAAPTTTTTAPTTTTTAPTTTTTTAAPTTTTTAPTTTTTAPTTTTTRATTTTTRPTTTTTRATTTTTAHSGGGGLLDLLRRLICYIFHFAC